MPRYLTSSTLCYSGIFAVAATLDAQAKVKRREQWDKAFTGIRNELEQLDLRANGALEKEEAKIDQTQQQFSAVEGEEDPFRLVNDNVRPVWPTSTGYHLQVHRLAPESIYATGERKARAAARRWSEKKLATMEVCMDILQLQFMSVVWQDFVMVGCTLPDSSNGVSNNYLRKLGFRTTPSPSGKTWEWDKQAFDTRYRHRHTALSTLIHAAADLSDHSEERYDQYSICRYSQNDLDEAHERTVELNTSLREVLQLRASGHITTPVTYAQIAYHLACTPSPPNLDTINTLLLGLTRPDDRKVARAVIKMILKTHMRPNEVTIKATLNHFTKYKDINSFAHWIQLMRGKHGGFALARPDIFINKAGKDRLVEKEGRPDKIIQLPFPTPIVFGSVIEGVLEFGGFDAAIRVCRGLAPEGWGLCMSGFKPLLKECANRSDWDAGFAIWQQIQQLKARSRRWNGARWESERVDLDTYAYMLRLCLNCDRPTAFDDIWNQTRWYLAHQHIDKLLLDLVYASAIPRRPSGISPEQRESPSARPVNLPNAVVRAETAAEGSGNEGALTNLCEPDDAITTAVRCSSIDNSHRLELPDIQEGFNQQLDFEPQISS